jgi:hypothetical protein
LSIARGSLISYVGRGISFDEVVVEFVVEGFVCGFDFVD